MAYAVFLRAANVGGNNVFRPKEFCGQHPELALHNIGAAGTFVSHYDGLAGELWNQMLAALPVTVEMLIVDGAQMVSLGGQKFPAVAPGAKREVTFLFDGVDRGTALSDASLGGAKEITVCRDLGWCVVTDRVPGGRLTPYKLVEDATGRTGTTRSWGVAEKVAALCES